LSSKKLLEFFKVIGSLKAIKRSGWISQVDIKDPETVADHSFRCAIIAMCIAELVDVKMETLVQMLLLHDLQESITGDFDSFKKQELGASAVKKLEKSAINKIFSLLPSEIKEKFSLLWNEFETQKTREAILANDIDKLEMAMQALEYEQEGWDSTKLEVFWTTAEKEIKTSEIRSLLHLLKEKRGS
jgi:putative hydrolase of HD superfamily